MSTAREKIEKISKDSISPYRGQKYKNTSPTLTEIVEDNVMLKFLVLYLFLGLFLMFTSLINS